MRRGAHTRVSRAEAVDAAATTHARAAPRRARPQVRVESVNQRLTPLCCAVATGNAPIVRMLLERGCANELAAARFVNKPTGPRQLTPLHLAVGGARGNATVCKMLLEYRANAVAAAADKTTALHFACATGRADCADLLLVTPGSTEDFDGARTINDFARGVTPLLVACLRGHADVVRVLLRHGASSAARTRPRPRRRIRLRRRRTDGPCVVVGMLASGTYRAQAPRCA